jgi:hypothetical protein
MATRTATTKPADDQVFDFNLNAVEAESELRRSASRGPASATRTGDGRCST